MQMYITFGPNLTSSRVHLLPQSSLPSFSLHQVFPRYKKENADLHNLKKSETTASGTGMVPFFSHSLKFTVWVIWGSENSAGPGLFNSLISGGKGSGSRQASDRKCWVSHKGRSQEGFPSVTTLGLETMTSVQAATLWLSQFPSYLGLRPRAGDTSHHLPAYLVFPARTPSILQHI